MRNTLRTAACTVACTSACLAALALPVLAHAQAGNYPTRPITMLLPVTPGAASDLEAKAWTELMSDSLGQRFVVDYKSGAGGVQAWIALAQAKPDGYTLATTTVNMALTPLRYDDPPFDPIKSFEHISILNKRINGLLVSTQFPINNIKEYVAYARANPGALNFTTSGEGSIDHVIGSWLMGATNTKLTFIHYKSSGAQQQDLLAGRSHIIANTYSESGGYAALVKSGKVKAIGTIAPQRSPLEPGIPTLIEQGLPDFEAPSFTGLVAPAKTPAAILNRLYAEVLRVSKLPELQKRVGNGTVIVASTPAEFRQAIQKYADQYRKVAQEFNINMKGE